MMMKTTLIGQKRDIGTLQIFWQSSDTLRNYSTGMNGEYDLKLLDIKFIGDGGANKEYFLQMISSTIKNDRANLNDNFKFHHINGQSSISNPVVFHDCVIKNWVDIDFVELGSVGDPLPANYNLILTFEYERLGRA